MSTSTRDRKRSIERLKSQVLDWILDVESSELTRVRWLFHSLIKLCLMVGRDFFKNQIQLHAMALAFKTLLSLAPLLAVIFSILKAFGVHNRMEPVLAEALAPLGEKGHEITAHLIGFVDQMRVGALGSIGLVTLFMTVLSLMGAIEQAFNQIWHVRAPRKLARKFSDYLSVILVGPVLMFAALTITATLQNNAFVRSLLAFEPFGMVILTLLRFIPYFTLWGAFTFFYVLIPNTRVRLKSAIIGGLVAAVLWQTVGWGFTVFVASSTRYYVIYSSFAILFLFLLWSNIGWVIVLLGAQVAYAHQHLHFYEADRGLLASSSAGREKLALHLMFLVGRNFFHGLDPLSVTELATQLQVPAGLVRDFMETFRQTRLVLPLADEETFVLARDPERIGIKEILDCVRGSGEKKKKQADGTEEEIGIEELLQEADDSVAKTLQGKSLQSLILANRPPSP
jgi:membrane protein